MRRLILGVIIFVGLCSTAVSRPEMPGRAAAIIPRLGSPNYREREAAFRELDALGEPALADLRSALASDDTETSRRAGELIGRIENRLAAIRILAPTMVDISIEKKSVPDAIRDVSSQTKLAISLVGDPSKLKDRKVTFKSGRVPVWVALSGFCKAADLTEWDGVTPLPGLPAPLVAQMENENQVIAVQGGMRVRMSNSRNRPQTVGRQICLYDGTSTPPSTQVEGAVRVRALPSTTPLPNFTVDSDEFFVPLQVALESKINWNSAPTIKIGMATDDHGRQFTASMVTGATYANSDELMMNQILGMPAMAAQHRSYIVPVRFQRQDQPVKTIRELSGSMTLPLRNHGELLAISDPMNAVGRTVRGVLGSSLTLHSIEKTAKGGVKFDVAIELPGDVFVSSQQVNTVMPGMQLQVQNGRMVQQLDSGAVNLARMNSQEYMGIRMTDGKGAQYQPQRLYQQKMTIADGTTARLTLEYSPPANVDEPVRLSLFGNYPTSVEVPFTFRDLPLP